MNNRESPPAIVITGIGMVTPVGYEASVAETSVRAGIQRFIEIEEESDRDGEFVIGAPISLLRNHPTPLIEMMKMSAIEAFDSAFESSEKILGKIWVSISATSQNQSDKLPLGRYPVEHLQASVGHIAAHPSSEIRYGGHTVVLEAVAEGIQRLRRQEIPACLIGGVDSLINTERLAWLDSQNRLKTDYNPHGLIPGEAAAFVVLELEQNALRRSAKCWAQMNNVGLGYEENHIYSQNSCLASGLSVAIQNATQEYCEPIRSLLGILCDLNGEPYRAKEWGLARSRVLRWAPEIEVWHPADCLGDVGASTGAVLLALGAMALRNGYAPTHEMLLWAGSDEGQRAAVLLTSVMKGE